MADDDGPIIHTLVAMTGHQPGIILSGDLTIWNIWTSETCPVFGVPSVWDQLPMAWVCEAVYSRPDDSHQYKQSSILPLSVPSRQSVALSPAASAQRLLVILT